LRNPHLTPELSKELLTALSRLTVAECYGIYLQIYPKGENPAWEKILKEYGSDMLAKDCGPITFYGGPLQRDDTGGQKFTQIKGSVLAFTIDFVLFELSTCEDNILESLEVPHHV